MIISIDVFPTTTAVYEHKTRIYPPPHSDYFGYLPAILIPYFLSKFLVYLQKYNVWILFFFFFSHILISFTVFFFFFPHNNYTVSFSSVMYCMGFTPGLRTLLLT